MTNSEKPKPNSAAMANVVLPLVIAAVGLINLIGWFIEGQDGSLPFLFILITIGPLIWAWVHRGDWANRYK